MKNVEINTKISVNEPSIPSRRLIIRFNKTIGHSEQILKITIKKNSKPCELHLIRKSPRPYKSCSWGKLKHSAHSHCIGIYSISNSVKDTDFDKICAVLSKRKDVVHVDKDVIGLTHSEHQTNEDLSYNADYWFQQWYFNKINYSSEYQELPEKQKIKVALIDTGIEVVKDGTKVKIVHPSLTNRPILLGRIGKKAIHDKKFLYKYWDEIVDLNGHGTHLCGIVTSDSSSSKPVIGLNQYSDIYVYKCTHGASNQCYLSDVVDSIYTFLMQEVKKNKKIKAVVNLSIGFEGISRDDVLHNSETFYAQMLKDLTDLFPNVIFVISSGNNFNDALLFPANCSDNAPNVTSLPGTKRNNIISVGAIDIKSNVVPYSNYGQGLSLVAPGKNIYSTFPSSYSTRLGYALGFSNGFAYLEGTSTSCAIVTAVLSLFWSTKGYTKDARDIIDALPYYCDHPKVKNNSQNFFGYGVLNTTKLFHNNYLFDDSTDMNKTSNITHPFNDSDKNEDTKLKTLRRQNLIFGDKYLREELVEFYITLFGADDFYNLLEELKNFSRSYKNTPYSKLKKDGAKYFKKLKLPCSKFTNAVYWAFIKMFDEEYESIWVLKDVFFNFVIDIKNKSEIDEKYKKDVYSIPYDFDMYRFQHFAHKTWSNNPFILKSFLLALYPNLDKLYEVEMTPAMVVSFIRMASDDNLIPLVPYDGSKTKSNIQEW